MGDSFEIQKFKQYFIDYISGDNNAEFYIKNELPEGETILYSLKRVKEHYDEKFKEIEKTHKENLEELIQENWNTVAIHLTKNQDLSKELKNKDDSYKNMKNELEILSERLVFERTGKFNREMKKIIKKYSPKSQ